MRGRALNGDVHSPSARRREFANSTRPSTVIPMLSSAAMKEFASEPSKRQVRLPLQCGIPWRTLAHCRRPPWISGPPADCRTAFRGRHTARCGHRDARSHNRRLRRRVLSVRNDPRCLFAGSSLALDWEVARPTAERGASITFGACSGMGGERRNWSPHCDHGRGHAARRRVGAGSGGRAEGAGEGANPESTGVHISITACDINGVSTRAATWSVPVDGAGGAHFYTPPGGCGRGYGLCAQQHTEGLRPCLFGLSFGPPTVIRGPDRHRDDHPTQDHGRIVPVGSEVESLTTLSMT